MRSLPFFLLLSLFAVCLVKFDRYCFKKNEGFCIRNIYSDLPYRSHWDVPLDSFTSSEILDKIFNQKFVYLNKGHQSYVFISEDQDYVVKFYRFPSHLRALPWLNHPFSYSFNPKRQKIKKYNLEKLDITFRSFKLAFEELKEQSGLIYLHNNKTNYLNRTIKVIDKLGMEYEVDLDSIPFVVQRTAQMLFPTLESLIAKNDLDSAKKTLSNLIDLIVLRAKKGIVDEDPVLERNYGLIDTDVIHIDIGRFVKEPEYEKLSDLPRKEVLKTTESLKHWLEGHHQALFNFYQTLIDQI
jgi:hypothetical protein